MADSGLYRELILSIRHISHLSQDLSAIDSLSHMRSIEQLSKKSIISRNLKPFRNARFGFLNPKT